MILKVALPLSLAFIMLTMGLSLVWNDFKRVARFPKAFLIGTFLQVITLPLLAFGICFIWDQFFEVNPAYLVGLIILSACPGGVTSNVFTYFSKGDTALSISLTAIISILGFFTIPFIVNFGLYQFLEQSSSVRLPVGSTILGIFCLTTLPVAIGVFLKSKWPKKVDRLEPFFRKIALILFGLIVIGAIASEWKRLVESALTLGPMTLALNLVAMSFAFIVAHVVRLSVPQTRAIVFECGLQNGTLAITIAGTFLSNSEMMTPAGLYALFMFGTGALYLSWCRRSDRKAIKGI